MDREHRQALDEREELIEGRARALAEEAVERSAPWTSHVGAPPNDPTKRRDWLVAISTVAAYRDRYAVKSAQPLGGPAMTDAQRSDRVRAGYALRQANRIVADEHARGYQQLAAQPLAIR